MDSPDIVLYFDNTIEILCSVYIIWKYLKGSNVNFIRCDTTNKKEILTRISNKNIILCDIPIFIKLTTLIDKCSSAHIISKKPIKLFDKKIKVFNSPLSIIDFTWKKFFGDIPMTHFINSMYEHETNFMYKYNLNNFICNGAYNFNSFYNYDTDQDLFESSIKKHDDKICLTNKNVFLFKIKDTLYSLANTNNIYGQCNNNLIDYLYCVIENKIIIRKANMQFLDIPVIKHIKQKATILNSWLYSDLVLTELLELEADTKIINLLETKKDGSFYLQGEPLHYLHLKMDKVESLWLTNLYLDFIKKKNLSSDMIIFEMPSADIYYDTINMIEKHKHKYIMIYNEHSILNKAKKMAHIITDNKGILVFETEKELSVLFTSMKK